MIHRLLLITCLAMLASAAVQAADAIPAPGEHPRLFFRAAELPRLKERAATPEGQAIVARLKYQLNQGDGKSLPRETQPRTTAEDLASEYAKKPVGTVYTLWHAAGYGMLWQLTGDKAYADLGRKATEMALDGVRDRDARYAFRTPSGDLRAGPALAAIAMGYDLCYTGWDEPFRITVAQAIQDYAEGHITFEALARGSRHGTSSNHFGGPVGGACLAALAIHGDPGTDSAKLDPLLDRALRSIERQLNEGIGTRGYYAEGIGAGQITTDTAFIPAIQALWVTGRKDLRGNKSLQWQTLRWPMMLVATKAEPFYPNPVVASSYGGQWFLRDGLSRGGQFVQGFGAVPAEFHPALLWTYRNVIQPGEAAANPDAGLKPGESSYDTVNPYPHRAVLALVNWPIATEPANPAAVLPRYISDGRYNFHVWRARWQDGNDPVIAYFGGLGTFGSAKQEGGIDGLRRLSVSGHGQRIRCTLPAYSAPAAKSANDASEWVITWSGGSMAVDFSPAAGDGIVLIAGAEIEDDRAVDGAGDGEVSISGTWVSAIGSEDLSKAVVLSQSGKTLTGMPTKQFKSLTGEVIGDDQIKLDFNLGKKVVELTGTVKVNNQIIEWSNGTTWYRDTYRRPEYVWKEGMGLKVHPGTVAGTKVSVVTFAADGKHPEVSFGDTIRIGSRHWGYSGGSFSLAQ